MGIAPAVGSVADDRADAELSAVRILFGRIHAVHPAARIVTEGFARVGETLERVAVAVAGDGNVVPRAAVIHRKPPQRAVELAVCGILRHILDLFAVGNVDLHGAVMPLVIPLPGSELRAAPFAGENVHPRIGCVVIFGHHEDDLDGIAVFKRLGVDRRAVLRTQIGVFKVIENVVFPRFARERIELLLIFRLEAAELHAARVLRARHGPFFKGQKVGRLCAVARNDQLQIVAVSACVGDDERIVLRRTLCGGSVEFPVRVDGRRAVRGLRRGSRPRKRSECSRERRHNGDRQGKCE